MRFKVFMISGSGNLQLNRRRREPRMLMKYLYLSAYIWDQPYFVECDEAPFRRKQHL